MRGYGFGKFAKKMRGVGMNDLQIESFRRHYNVLLSGERCTLGHSLISPVQHLPALAELTRGVEASAGDEIADQIALLKLNGGLGTSMGLRGPKSLLVVRRGMSFLDTLMHQVEYFRKNHAARLPVILLNSFATRTQTLQALQSYAPLLEQCVPFELVQSQVPKVMADDYAPAVWAANPELEWCPPGHGDVYLSLYISGILDSLLGNGIRYLFMSNIDNLGATVDVRIPLWMKQNQVPFVMEVAERCETDRKGGHLARYHCGELKGNLVLREVAMCPKEEAEEFQDIEKYRFFNTNSVWLDMQAWKKLLEERQGLVDLPLIINRKPLDPHIPHSPGVIQLESAMGGAISSFANSVAVEVPRERFAPVKNLCDLLAVRSDAYEMTEEYGIRLAAGRSRPPIIKLDRDRFRRVEDLSRWFPAGPPGLLECESLSLNGPITFSKGVRCRGNVTIDVKRPCTIPERAILTGTV